MIIVKKSNIIIRKYLFLLLLSMCLFPYSASSADLCSIDRLRYLFGDEHRAFKDLPSWKEELDSPIDSKEYNEVIAMLQSKNVRYDDPDSAPYDLSDYEPGSAQPFMGYLGNRAYLLYRIDGTAHCITADAVRYEGNILYVKNILGGECMDEANIYDKRLAYDFVHTDKDYYMYHFEFHRNVKDGSFVEFDSLNDGHFKKICKKNYTIDDKWIEDNDYY